MSKIKLVAIASGGGHWVQLMRLRPAFRDCDVTFITTDRAYRAEVGDARLCVVPNSNYASKLRLIATAAVVFWLLLRERPHVIVTTGAAPGYFAVRLGKLLGARTIWIDSIANADRLSLAGRKAGPCADLWLTQWPHLAREGGPYFHGNVL